MIVAACNLANSYVVRATLWKRIHLFALGKFLPKAKLAMLIRAPRIKFCNHWASCFGLTFRLFRHLLLTLLRFVYILRICFPSLNHVAICHQIRILFANSSKNYIKWALLLILGPLCSFLFIVKLRCWNKHLVAIPFTRRIRFHDVNWWLEVRCNTLLIKRA